MKITLDHPEALHGRPVILDDDGSVMPTRPGAIKFLRLMGIKNEQFAEMCCVSRHTVYSWLYAKSNRPVTTEALNVLMKLGEKEK